MSVCFTQRRAQTNLEIYLGLREFGLAWGVWGLSIDFMLFNCVCPSLVTRIAEMAGLNCKDAEWISSPLIKSRTIWRMPLQATVPETSSERGLLQGLSRLAPRSNGLNSLSPSWSAGWPLLRIWKSSPPSDCTDQGLPRKSHRTHLRIPGQLLCAHIHGQIEIVGL